MEKLSTSIPHSIFSKSIIPVRTPRSSTSQFPGVESQLIGTGLTISVLISGNKLRNVWLQGRYPMLVSVDFRMPSFLAAVGFYVKVLRVTMSPQLPDPRPYTVQPVIGDHFKRANPRLSPAVQFRRIYLHLVHISAVPPLRLPPREFYRYILSQSILDSIDKPNRAHSAEQYLSVPFSCYYSRYINCI